MKVLIIVVVIVAVLVVVGLAMALKVVKQYEQGGCCSGSAGCGTLRSRVTAVAGVPRREWPDSRSLRRAFFNARVEKPGGEVFSRW